MQNKAVVSRKTKMGAKMMAVFKAFISLFFFINLLHSVQWQTMVATS